MMTDSLIKTGKVDESLEVNNLKIYKELGDGAVL
jgi:hypothetical protein